VKNRLQWGIAKNTPITFHIQGSFHGVSLLKKGLGSLFKQP